MWYTGTAGYIVNPFFTESVSGQIQSFIEEESDSKCLKRFRFE